MEFLRSHQLDIMLILIGICGIQALFVMLSKTLSRKRKCALFSLEMSAMLLLIFDRFAYIFRGDVSQLGFWMVRISNFLVFFFSITILYAFNSYHIDLVRNEGGVKNCPVTLRICKVLTFFGIVLLVVSQFTNLYYSFDEHNCYARGKWIALSYVCPIGMLLLQLIEVLRDFKRLRKLIVVPLLFFTILPVIATILQMFMYGISLTNIASCGMVIMIYIFSLIDLNDTAGKAKAREIELLKEEQKKMGELFEQTATALANAIDAKDKYTHGHSMRVAEYSQRIARYAGRDEKFCSEVYFAGLLHDVGKIGVPVDIINKDGKLTDEEYAEIKKHPIIGRQILSSISRSPYLSIGANYHHERYDGRGYPDGLKGDDIPDIARIIAVADAYDAMTSKRSYRDPIPQHKVREEIVKGIGYQFDPEFAKIMLHLIDVDTEYQMKEREQVQELAGKNILECDGNRSSFSEGLRLTENISRFRMRCRSQDGFNPADSVFSLILFDSLDGRIHIGDDQEKEMVYTEFAEIHFDGSSLKKDARKIQSSIKKERDGWNGMYRDGIDFEGEAVKFKDHVQIRISCAYQTATVTVALRDSSRFTYMSLTGAHCVFSNVEFIKTEDGIGPGYITRIADEVSYIDGPAGDIPNVQVNGWKTSASQAVPIVDGMTISFHSKSLPTARLIWHCPFVTIFYSDDKIPDGKNYCEFVCVRFDGENWEGTNVADNSILINKTDDFENWQKWKELNKAGLDCTVKLRRQGKKITLVTENGGIAIRSVTTVKVETPEIYVALTGDQCAITNIRIRQALKTLF
ncbi:MAG: HD-GYP domain-containing protein [Treponema sp.]|nr:HD-GYP domain-containing protein [Treponema sp.]